MMEIKSIPDLTLLAIAAYEAMKKEAKSNEAKNGKAQEKTTQTLALAPNS